MSSENYARLGDNEEFFAAFIESVITIDLGERLYRNILMQIIASEIDSHNVYEQPDGDYQMVHRHFVYVFSPYVYDRHMHVLQKYQFNSPVTFIRYDEPYIKTSDSEGTVLDGERTLDLLVKQTNSYQVVVRQSTSIYGQYLFRQGYNTNIRLACMEGVHPVYYALSDSLGNLDNTNASVFMQSAILQALRNLYPEQDKKLISSYADLEVFSVPVYSNVSGLGWQLRGFFHLILDISSVFEHRRDIVQYGEVVARSHDAGEVVRRDLIDTNRDGIQIIEQDGFLHVVDQKAFNADIKVRASYVLDAVLNYSTHGYTVDQFGPNGCEVFQDDNYLRCAVMKETAVFREKSEQHWFHMVFNLTTVSRNTASQTEYRNKAMDLINSSRYNTQFRLIADQIAMDAVFVSQNVDVSAGQSFQVEPQVFCTVDGQVCGFTNFTIGPTQNLWDVQRQLLSMHNTERNLASTYDYTRVVFFQALNRYYVVQRHYFSVNVDILQANSTFLVNLVCVPMPSLVKPFFADCRQNYTQYVHFINYNGIVEYSASCQDESVTIGSDVGKSVLDISQMAQEYAIVTESKLIDKSRSVISFLDGDEIDRGIHVATLVEYQVGGAVYERFEGGLLLLYAELAITDRQQQDATIQSSNLFLYNASEYVNLNFTKGSTLSFHHTRRFQLRRDKFDETAERFKNENPALFADEVHSGSHKTGAWRQAITGAVCGVAAIVIYLM